MRVTAPGGHVVIYAPNRLYLFETHGIYVGKRFVFRLVPFVNWLPNFLRDRFCPHVRAYTRGQIRGCSPDCRSRSSSIPTFTRVDNIVARRPALGRTLRSICYGLEGTPLRAFGLSHFLVARVDGVADRGEPAAAASGEVSESAKQR